MSTTAAPATTPATAFAAKTLDIDRAFRRVGVSDDLHPLESLQCRSWDYSSPTLVMDGSSNSDGTYTAVTMCPSVGAFAKLFYKKYPLLEGIPLDGMVIAGGAVGQFIRLKKGQPIWEANDIDAFICGHKTPEASQARLVRFVQDIDGSYHRICREKVRAAVAAKLDAVKAQLESMRAPAQIGMRGVPTVSPTALSSTLALKDNIERVMHALTANPAKFVKKEGGDGESKITYQMECPNGVLTEDWQKLAPICQYDVWNVVTVRTAGSVTITHGGTAGLPAMKIQVIFRHYAHASEVLHGFDMGPSAVGFNGDNVYLTSLGKVSYEYGINIVDPSRRSPTFEARLSKYLDRGFLIVVPSLNIGALGSKPELKYDLAAVADLPFMPFAYTSAGGGRVCLMRFVKGFGNQSDYGPEGELVDGVDGDSDFRLAYLNLHRLVSGRTDFLYVVDAPGFGSAVLALTSPPHLDIGMIQSLYDRFQETVWNGRQLNLLTLRRYLPAADVGAIAAMADVPTMKSMIAAAFDRQRAEAIRLWNANIKSADHSAIPWITENPGKQGLLTGSRQPIDTTPAEWYGAAYFSQ